MNLLNTKYSIKISTKIKIALFSLGLLLVLQVQAATISSRAGGDFFSTATWNGGVVPSATDDVSIGGHTITFELTGNYTIKSLTMNWNAEINITTTNPNYVLTITDGITIASIGTTTFGDDVKINTSAITINGYQAVIAANAGSDLTVSGAVIFNASEIDFDLNGNMSANSISYTGGNSSVLDIDAASTINVATSLTLSSGPNTIDVYGVINTNTLEANGGTNYLNIYLGGEVNVTGGIVLSGSAGLNIENSGNLNVDGDVDMSGGSSLDVDGNMDVSGDFTMANGIGSVNIDGNLNVDGTLDLGDNTVNGTGNITVGALTCATGINCESQIPNATLPIELISFDVFNENGIIILKWETATETNNDYFTIERSTDAINFEPIAEINGAGNSNTSIKYSYSDNSPIPGVNYYRLKQTDYNGDFEYFQKVSINNNMGIMFNDAISYSIKNSFVRIELKSSSSEIIAVQLISVSGSIINTWHIDPNTMGIDIPLINQKPGVYILTFSGSTIYQSKKIVWDY